MLVFVSPCNAKASQYPGAGLYIFDLETGVSYPLLDAPMGEFDPAWSPDGAKIAFTSLRDNDNWQIFVYDLGTSTLAQLTTAENNTQSRYPAWSPDGSKLVYTHRRLGVLQIWSMNADGSEKSRLAYPLGSAIVSSYIPTWSRDGTFVLYSETNLDLTSPSWLMRLNSGMQTGERLTALGAPVVDVNFSPDGLWIAYESTDGNNQDIYLFNLLAGEKIRLTESLNIEFDPAWKP